MPYLSSALCSVALLFALPLSSAPPPELANPVLSVTGQCPGTVTFNISGAKSLSILGLAYGHAGSFTIGKGACIGAPLAIADPKLASLILIDINGTGSWTVAVPPAACGLTIQGLDMFTCMVTNSMVL